MSPASEKSDLQYTSGAMHIGDPRVVRSSKRISVSTALYTNVREERQIVRIIFNLQAEISYHELITGEGSVGGHEEVASRCWDKWGNDADEVIVHVAGVPEGLCTGCHDGCDLHGEVTTIGEKEVERIV